MQRRWIIQDERLLKTFCGFFRNFRTGDVKYEFLIFTIYIKLLRNSLLNLRNSYDGKFS
jgi:hypothetical protein